MGSSPQRTQRGRSAGEGGGAVEHRLADDTVDLQRPAVPIRGGQTRAERVQLVVQPLLGDLVLGDQAAAMPHRGGECVLDLIGHQPALTLAGEIGQRGAVPVIGLESPRTQLRAGRSGLRGREQPHRSGKALVQLAHPGLVQAAGGLDGEHRPRGPDVIDDESVQLLQPRTQYRQ